jgi:type I restriction enzyme S subunit
MDKLPNGWKWTTINEVCDKITDGTHKTPSYKDKGVPFLSVKDITKGYIDFSNTRFISLIEHNELSKRCSPKRNDILYTKVGTTGVAKVVDTDREFSLFVSLALLKPKKKIIESYFFEHLLNSPFCYEQSQEKTRGVANRNLVLTDIKSIQIPLPPVSEQTRIVSKLDTLFARIDKSIALLEENIKHTKALMASVLEELFEKLKAKSTIYKIKDIAEIKGGKRLPKGESIQEEKTEYPYIRVTDFTDDGTIDVNSVKYLTRSVQEQIKRYIITSKDLYISIAGTIGKTGIIPKELENANLTENAARLVFKPTIKINNRFVYYFTLSDNFKDQVGLATKTVAQPKLALTRLAEVELPIPSIEVQNKEVQIFDELSRKFQEINKEQQSKLSYLKALKSSILDRAFKGDL